MLRILTWNIWFNKKSMILRYQTILSIVKESNPDICCFQECVPDFINLMSMDDYWFNNYDFSDLDIFPYGTIILSKKYLEFNFRTFDLPTNMSRKIIVGTNVDLTVGSTHLESLNSTLTRELQLKEIGSLLNSYGSPNTILCGDFNFCSESNYSSPQIPLENNFLEQYLPRYIDVWASTPKIWTWDGKSNTNIKIKKQMRLDRIMCKTLNLKITNKYLVGTTMIPEIIPNIFPSYHNGLVVNFDIKS